MKTDSGRTTAHLTPAVDDRYFELQRLHGEKGARLVHESHAVAVDAIERTSRELGIGSRPTATW